jgi:phosphatidylglycerol:prolipoprotein diacylglycerol transferase
MLPTTLTIGFWTVRLYTLVLALAVVVSAGVGVARSRGSGRVGAVVDVYIGGLIGAVILARLVHVLINWDYFVDNLSEAPQISAGGLDWHGAVIGGLIGMMLVARAEPLVQLGQRFALTRRRVDLAMLHDSWTLALPLIALAGWFGCLSELCGYGAEVPSLADYPSFLVWEAQDIFGIEAPRFNTQLLGLLLGAFLLGVALVLLWRGWLRERRFWLVLVLLSAGMFAIGFLRGDHALHLFGLRLDQWLDIGMLLLSGWQLVMRRENAKSTK